MAPGRKTGGRTAGTPNKSSEKVKGYLDGIFDEVFASPTFRAELVRQIVTLEIDRGVLTLLLHYYAGRPGVAVDHTVTGTLSLAQLIVGEVPAADDAADEPSEE